MRCVHTTSDRAVAQLLCGALESHGIVAIVDGEHLSPLQGLAVPAGPAAHYRVCIVDPEQLPAARIFVNEWLGRRAARPAPSPWRCEACGEPHEGQFSSCWRCGRDRNGSGGGTAST